MTEKSQTRREIEAEMAKVALDAYREGGMDAAKNALKAAFPGMPSQLVSDFAIDAELAVEEAETNQYFNTLERTIDGEVIRAAARTAADEAAERDRRIAMATDMARGLRLVPKTKRAGKGAPR